MKKLHSIAYSALITPVIALGAGSALAQQSTDQDMDQNQQSTQTNQGTGTTGAGTGIGIGSEQDPMGVDQQDQDSQFGTDQDSQLGTDYDHMNEQSRGQNLGFMDNTPSNGMQVSDLMGSNVRASDNEDIGSVDDMIVDSDGQIVAIIVSVGGFLGIGDREVAVGWDDVTRSGDGDDQELRINRSSEELKNAPEYRRNN
ncbi:MAG: PRC-barrel domain-containing protein [Saccharospirillum sp.]|nr:PRC-barrel domain-containing protein [Saccharospirillum sp.]